MEKIVRLLLDRYCWKDEFWINNPDIEDFFRERKISVGSKDFLKLRSYFQEELKVES
jgi:hypothetical protein